MCIRDRWNVFQPPIYADEYSDQLMGVAADGSIPVPDGPGLGLHYDWEKIRNWETGREVYD